MHLPLRALVLGFVALSASPALAQYRSTAPPEPVPMGTPYVYQLGNPNWYRPVANYPASYSYYPSTYPSGSTAPVFGLYPGVYRSNYPTTTYWWNPEAVWTYPAATWDPWTGWTYPAARWYPETGWIYPAAYPMPGRIFLGGGR
jgi:hypothetical protein